MLRHWIFCLFHESSFVHACCSIHNSAQTPFLTIFWMLQHWLFCQFFSLLDAMACCAQCCGIETTANLLNSANAMAFNLQCLGIWSTFFILLSFCIFSFFFQFQCSSYHLQHKIPCKSVQNDNNTNKIPKYRDLKIHIFLVISISPHLDFISPRAN